jgi:hypothetical protein
VTQRRPVVFDVEAVANCDGESSKGHDIKQLRARIFTPNPRAP